MAGAVLDVTIRLDRERKLRFDLRAIRDIEQAIAKLKGSWDGVSIDSVVQTDPMPVSFMIVMLWACLKRDDPAITEDQVADLLTGADMDEVADALKQAVEAASPEAKALDETAGDGGRPLGDQTRPGASTG